jgi:hypothetical protein
VIEMFALLNQKFHAITSECKNVDPVKLVRYIIIKKNLKNLIRILFFKIT